MTKSSVLWSGTSTKHNENSKDGEMMNSWPIQGVKEHFSKELNIK
jgi:hypothetical protein